MPNKSINTDPKHVRSLVFSQFRVYLRRPNTGSLGAGYRNVIRKIMEYIDDYQSCSRTYATLLIYPKEQNPGAITEILGINPTDTSFKGGGTRGTNVNGWFLSTQGVVESKDSRRHIDWLIDQIFPIKNKIISLQATGAQIEVSCFWESATGNGGPTMSPSQMARLADLNLEIWWDVWFNINE